MEGGNNQKLDKVLNHNADMVYKHKPIYSKDIIIYHY